MHEQRRRARPGRRARRRRSRRWRADILFGAAALLRSTGWLAGHVLDALRAGGPRCAAAAAAAGAAALGTLGAARRAEPDQLVGAVAERPDRDFPQRHSAIVRRPGSIALPS